MFAADPSAYEYNGLHWRTVRQGLVDGDLQTRVMYYSALSWGAWQLIEEHIDDDEDLDPDRIAQQFWGIRYIDDAVCRRIDADADADGEYDDPGDGTWFHVTDVQFSSVAMIDDAANLVERVAHDAYGRSRHQWPADIDGDGDVDSADDAIMDALSGSSPIAITSGSYNADADIDRDGDVDSTDAQAVTDALTTAALAPGQISDPAGADNPIGYDGYVFNATDGTCTARYRTYQPDLGRWLSSDPLEWYGGSINYYELNSSAPLTYLDPSGLGPPSLVITGGLENILDNGIECDDGVFTVRAPTDPGWDFVVEGKKYDSLEAVLVAVNNVRARYKREGRRLRTLVIQSHGFPGGIRFPIVKKGPYLTLELLREIDAALCDPCSIDDTRRDELNRYISILDELFQSVPAIDFFSCDVARSNLKPGSPEYEPGRGLEFLVRLRDLRLMDPNTECTFHLRPVAHRRYLAGDPSNILEILSDGIADQYMTLCGVQNGRVEIPRCDCPRPIGPVAAAMRAGMLGGCAGASILGESNASTE